MPHSTSDTTSEEQKGDARTPFLSPKDHPGWTPTYLRARTLIGFVIVYLLLLIGVIVLAVVDAKRNGITTARSSEHYLWTYGPTAILAVVAALWGQVELRTKQAMPWAVLQRRPTAASKTLLLDYVTPSLLESLYGAMRSAHWPVAIAITSSLLLKLLTVASTGLLILQKTPVVRYDCPLSAVDDFANHLNTTVTGSAPVLAVQAIQNNTIGYPGGTTRDAAFQTSAPPLSLRNVDGVLVEFVAKTFTAGLQCETAKIINKGSSCSDRRCRDYNTTIDIISPTCSIENYGLTMKCSIGREATSCGVNTTWGIGCTNHMEGHDKNRLVFMDGEMKQNEINSLTSQNITEIVTDNTTIVLCEPKYNISMSLIRMDGQGNIIKSAPHDSSPDAQTTLFPAWNLVDSLRTSTQAAGAAFGFDYYYNFGVTNPWYLFTKFWQTWVQNAYPSSNLRDANTIQSKASEWFGMVSAQMVKQNAMVPAGDHLGTCYTSEDRLRVRGLSLYLMIASLSLLILFTGLLIWTRPRCYASRDPSSIGGLALVLSQSSIFLSQLRGYGHASLKTIKERLKELEVESIFTMGHKGWRFAFEATNRTQLPGETPDSRPQPAHSWWHPVSLHLIFKICVIATLLILIAVLEVMYSVSQKHRGIAQVETTSYVRFAWAYVPAIVMLIAQTLVGMIVFSSFLIYPYFVLRKKPISTWDDTLRDYLSHVAIEAVYNSAMKAHWPILLLAISTLITPLLTIVVSGLYTPLESPFEISTTLSMAHQFNSSFSSNELSQPDHRTIATNVGLLLSQNFTSPVWTYGELAFPTTALPSLNISTPGDITRSNITAIIPALRAYLNCRIVTGYPKNYSDSFGTGGPGCGNTWPHPGPNPFGFFSLGNRSEYCGAYGLSDTNWTAFTCSSVINQLDVAITLDASSNGTILEAHPDEKTVKTFSNGTIAATGSAWPSIIIPSLFGTSNFVEAVAGFYDPVFQAVIYEAGTTDDLSKFPMDNYMDDEGFMRIVSHLQSIHRTIAAQCAFTIQIPLTPARTINATIHVPGVFRLQQSVISTRILDGLLASIALCLALTLGLMNTRKVLPKNPVSIAAGASLIAENTEWLAQELPPDAQWSRDEHPRKMQPWGALLFNLGWEDGKESRNGEGKSFGLHMRKGFDGEDLK
ncbi:hypothetical protein DM02DRAFT_691295 [Periconia macrospinosa]|uniref:Uncharacterized protein n=1 Tax=Periconia macrospinosa TaxID=97972 RepID=A0A2V1DAJ2_9PLEO|nr:hypothetical protein DM02DRAFT_691295 [Periconia macrospinosa]